MNEEHKAALGARLRRLRHQQGLTQQTVAKAAGVSIQSIRTWEPGRCAYHPWRAPELAAALGVPIASLFVDEPVLAEIRLSEATLQAVRDQGRAASEAAAGRIAAQLEPLIFQAATRPEPDGRAQRRRTRPEKLNIPKRRSTRRTVE